MDEKEKEIIEHKRQFEEIVKKYNFAEEEKAQELATFLTKPRNGEKLSSEEFAALFGMSEKEAVVFLSFIEKGLEFGQKFNKL